MVDDCGRAAAAALNAGLGNVILHVAKGWIAEGINEVGEARGVRPGAASVHDDAVEQGAVVEHVDADLRDRLGDLGNLEIVGACEGVLEEMKKEKGSGGKGREGKGEKKKGKERGGEGGLLTLPMDSSWLGPSVVSKTTRAR